MIWCVAFNAKFRKRHEWLRICRRLYLTKFLLPEKLSKCHDLLRKSRDTVVANSVAWFVEQTVYSQTSATYKEPKHVIGITGNHMEVRQHVISLQGPSCFIVKQTCIWFFIWRSSSIPCFHSLFQILSEMLKVSLVLVWEVSNSTWSKNRSFCVLSLERWNLRRPACLSNLTVRSILPYCKCPYRQQKNKRTEELIKLSILELRWVFCVCFCPGFCLSGYIQSAWRHRWSFSGQWVCHKCVSSKKALEAI